MERLPIAILTVAFGVLPAISQVPASLPEPSPKSSALVALARSALSGTVLISDETLQGTATWFDGAQQLTGTATLAAKGKTESRLEFRAGQLSRLEIRNELSGPVGEVVDSDGIHRTMAIHNCWTIGPWFSPISIVEMMSSPDVTVSYIGQEQRDGLSVDHLVASRMITRQKPSTAETIRRLSTIDVFLDPATHVPLTIAYQTHPPDDYSRDIPVEIRFGDYAPMKGIMVPRRIQRLLNGSLTVDISISDVSINSNLADSTFGVTPDTEMQ